MFVCVFLLLCLLGFGDRLMVNFWFGITQNCLTVLKVRKQNRSHWIKLRSLQSKALRKNKLFLADKGPKSLFFFPQLLESGIPALVFLPGESQGQTGLVGCCLWGHTELDTTEVT